MIYDAFAAKEARTPRLIQTVTFLEAKINNDKEADQIRTTWAKQAQNVPMVDDWSKVVTPKSEELQGIFPVLPPGSWAIQFTFMLATPYLSKGIEAFDLLDNPIIRDKAYEVPIVPASSWKGGLRAAALMYLVESTEQTPEAAAKDPRIIRLFGNEREVNEGFRAGRLHCFPTGFGATCCQVINPHDRARRVGRQPILLECVAKGQSGTFTALYVPFGHSTLVEAAHDVELCAHAIRDLLLAWGIGAKKSNGSGLARDEITDLYLGPQKKEDVPEPQPPALPDICRQYEERFGTDYQTVKPRDWKPHDGADFARYKAAREAHQAHKDILDAYPRLHKTWENRPRVSLSIIARTKLTDLSATIQAQVIPVLMKGHH